MGENLLFAAEDYPLTATCLENTLRGGLTGDSFEKLGLENPDIGLQVIKNLSNRIAWCTSQVGSLSLRTLEARLYHVQANIAQEQRLEAASVIFKHLN